MRFRKSALDLYGFDANCLRPSSRTQKWQLDCIGWSIRRSRVVETLMSPNISLSPIPVRLAIRVTFQMNILVWSSSPTLPQLLNASTSPLLISTPQLFSQPLNFLNACFHD